MYTNKHERLKFSNETVKEILFDLLKCKFQDDTMAFN
jgi:hypothetical protein